MNPERKKAAGICSELDGAFATVQAASLQREPGYGDAQNLARECVLATVANINRRLVEETLSPTETSVIEAKVQALIRAAARIPGPDATTAREHQPAKAALPGR